MTRWVRCGSSQKHKKMPGNATKWGEFDNQHAREIQPKKKKSIESQIDLNEKINSLLSTSYKDEESLEEHVFDEGKFCSTGKSNKKEINTFDESHLSVPSPKNEQNDNIFSMNKMQDAKIKKRKKQNNLDIEPSSLGENADVIDSSEVFVRHKKIKLENDCFVESQNSELLEKDNCVDFAENSKISEESFNMEHNKKKRKKKKRNNEMSPNRMDLQNNSSFDESLLQISPSKNEQDDNVFLTNKMHDAKIKKKKKQNKSGIDQSFLGEKTEEVDPNEIPIRRKKIKLENGCFIESQTSKLLETDNNCDDFAKNSIIAEESFTEEHDKKKRKKKRRNDKGDSESFSRNDETMETSLLSLANSNESFTEEHDKKKRKKNRNNKDDSENFSRNDETRETSLLSLVNSSESFTEDHDKKKEKKKRRNNKGDSVSFSRNDEATETSLSLVNSNECHSIKQETEFTDNSDKTTEPDQSFEDINESSKKQKGKKFSKINTDSNQSPANNESCKNSPSKSKIFENKKKEQRLRKLKQKREELGLIQLPHNVENKLRKTKKRLVEKGFPPEKLKEIMRQERRKEELNFRKVYNPRKLCFGCREPGHVFADCPQKSKSLKQETGICFKCGSVEHVSYKCPKEIQGFPYAKCFICKEQGHISRECPKNKHGVYPKGGRCKLCGNVNHLKKDCPTLKKKENEEEITLPTLNEAASIDDEVVKKEEIKKKNKKEQKIVKF